MPSSEIASDTLAITLFGPMQVRVHGLPLPPLRSRKPLWLLALLTLRANRPVERAWLAGTLWPDLDQSKAFANLRPVLSELRTALATQGTRLQSPDRTTLVLDLTDAKVDLLRFDAVIASGKLSDLQQAVALYRGSLLEGCHEEWVFQEREAREQVYLQALQKLGEASLAGGEYDAASGYFQQAVRSDPWGEAARRGWMEALSRNGDTNAALQVYREFVAFLKDDPKAVPDEQTRALYERLRAEVRQRAGTHAVVAAEAVAVPKVKGYLPHPLTDLVGREDERLEVALQLRRSRLVTLTGMGGIGKTRLAREVASEVVREYADGVWLVALEVLTEGRLVIQQIGSVLGLREEQGRTPLQSVTDHLRNKQVLLVLDNCEHLLEASAQVVSHLLAECAQVRILATSREALGIVGETVWSVPSLTAPDPAHLLQSRSTLLRVLMGYESVQLFVERAQSVQKSFLLTESNARRVAEVCFGLEGIPLAIELAAARVKAMSVEQIASRLEDSLSLLTAGSRTAQSRQQTLRATLDWSYALLSEGECRVLRRLSVFAGGCRLEAAEFVCSTGEGIPVGIPELRHSGVEEQAEPHRSGIPNTRIPNTEHLHTPSVLDLLASLVDKSLVLFEERGPAEGRYRLLEMVRQYAGESLQASGESEQIKRKHRDWCVAFAEEEQPRMRSAEQEKSLQRLETEHENLRTALGWCRAEENGAQAGLRLAGALGRFWEVRGYMTEGRRYLAEALGREEGAGRTPERARALNCAGVLAHRQGDYASARSLTEESLAIRRELGDRLGIAYSLNNLGILAKDQGDYASARVLFEESLEIRRELGDRRGLAGSLNNLGTVALDQGDYASARALYEEALTLNREFGNRVWEAIYLYNLGLLAHQKGDYAPACRLHEESLAIRRELGDRRGIAESLWNLGRLASDQGDIASARNLFEESLGIQWELGDRLGIAQSLDAFAYLALKEESGERAARLWGAEFALCESIGVRRPPNWQENRERDLTAVRGAIGEAAFAAAWEIGHALTLEQAVAYALEPESVSPTHGSPAA